MVVGRSTRSMSGRTSSIAAIPTRATSTIPSRSRLPSSTRVPSASISSRVSKPLTPSNSQSNSSNADSQMIQTDAKPSTTDGDNSKGGSNIKVVVRCRGRNEREIKAKSGVIISTSPAQHTDVLVSLDGSTNRATGQDTKTYKLDHVFGPEADQSMVYDEVVAPMLSEVIAGMNCTIFAYGQTGTGKTWVLC